MRLYELPDSYDAWKTRTPEDEQAEETCEECGLAPCCCFEMEREEEERRSEDRTGYLTDSLK